ncbi:MAG TPA: hypothetical protein VH088_23265 [Terriglobales bacterium]|jgi:hypothetical protein|nr:hypothetical protein [Terriglobales bacterium]
MKTEHLKSNLADLQSADAGRQDSSFNFFMEATKEPVDWAYEIWDDMLALLKTGDNKQRAISSQVLCGLAKSDPKKRMRKDLARLLEVTKDERFVTARHCMQSLWKVGVAGDSQRKALVKGLVERFKECAKEKNGTLIRYDILQSLRRVYDTVPDESLPATAGKLIELEKDPKYKKKYATLWRQKA